MMHTCRKETDILRTQYIPIHSTDKVTYTFSFYLLFFYELFYFTTSKILIKCRNVVQGNHLFLSLRFEKKCRLSWGAQFGEYLQMNR